MNEKKDAKTVRELSEKVMRCKTCGRLMFIGAIGLVCEAGCGPLCDPYPFFLDNLKLAWPEQVIDHRPQQKARTAMEMAEGKLRKARQGDP